MILDLFAGIRGWGGDGIGIEIDSDACTTAARAGHLTVRADVTTFPLDHLPPVTGICASPPCQTFSAAGNREGIVDLVALVAHVHRCVDGWHDPPEFSDPRTALVLQPLRYALTLEPEWLALEQVPDVLPVWEAYQMTLRQRGWSAWTGILNAADYGVPQTRRRAILMASRTRVVGPPEPTHCRGGALTMFGELAPWVSMAEAFRGGDRLEEERSADLPANSITSRFDRWVINTGRDWKEGGSREDAQRPVTDPAPAIDGKGRWHLERPATTISGDDRCWAPGHKINQTDIDRLGVDEATRRYGDRAGTDAIRLTIRDALTLQSFPPDYPVVGTKTSQFRQVGNAIPLLLGTRLVEHLAGRENPK